MKKTALYIGRFQPFHKGHADAIDQILKEKQVTKLYIGIGSAENNYELKNPLTAGERMQLIESAMQEKNIPADRYAIVPIRNINHYALWPMHVQQYLPPIDILYSGSPLVRQLWKQAFCESKVIEINKREKISGTQIRSAISEKNNDILQKYLLPSTQKYMIQWEIKNRLTNMTTQ